MRAKRNNLGFNEINALEIAASLTLLAMTTKNGFFRILLEGPWEISLKRWTWFFPPRCMGLFYPCRFPRFFAHWSDAPLKRMALCSLITSKCAMNLVSSYIKCSTCSFFTGTGCALYRWRRSDRRGSRALSRSDGWAYHKQGGPKCTGLRHHRKVGLS